MDQTVLPISKLTDTLKHTFEMSDVMFDNLIATGIAIFMLFLLRFVVLKIVHKQTTNVRTLYKWRKSTLHASFALGILVVGRIWFDGFDSVSTYLGLLSAGLAIALKDPVVNLAGWAFILWRRPFAVGDRIQLGEHRGDVIDQRLFMFSLIEIGNWIDADQSTGRVIHIPNGRVFNEMIANYSAGFHYIWDEIAVLVTFESHWRDAKSILQDVINNRGEKLSALAEKRLKKAAGKMMIFFNKLTPIVYTSVRDSGVLLTIRYLCEPRKRRSTQEAIWEEILDRFGERDDIDFAYPTTRLYDNRSEGKPQARAD